MTLVVVEVGYRGSLLDDIIEIKGSRLNFVDSRDTAVIERFPTQRGTNRIELVQQTVIKSNLGGRLGLFLGGFFFIAHYRNYSF